MVAMTEISVYVAAGADKDTVRDLVEPLLPPDYSAWGVDDTAADYPGYVMAVDLHHRPEAELLRWAEAIKAVVKKDLGVDAELDTVLDRIDAKSI